MKDHSIEVASFLPQIEGLEQQGKTVMLMAVENQIAGLFAVADTIKTPRKQ